MLLPAGFERAGTATWVRHRSELDHVVALVAHYDSRIIQWGMVVRDAADFVWGKPPKGIDVGDSIVTGHPGTTGHPPACGLFQLGQENDPAGVNEIAGKVAIDMRGIEAKFQSLSTRRELRSYMLEDTSPSDPRFIVPSSPALKAYVVRSWQPSTTIPKLGVLLCRLKRVYGLGPIPCCG